MTSTATALGPMVDEAGVTFRLPDPGRARAAVGLVQEIVRPRDWITFEPPGPDGVWTLRFPRPPVDRMEYQLKAVFRHGGEEVFCDPGNPLRVPGAFGDKSVVEMPGYAPPRWLTGRTERAGEILSTTVASRTLRADVPVTVWSSAGADPEARLPLLIALDGSEYAAFSSLVVYLDTMQAAGVLPPMRAALVDPVDRNEHYSASAAHARAMATEILPALDWLAPGDAAQRIGMGASLGGLAMLHLHRTRPDSLGGLYLQSGSYFRQRFDKQEAGFPRFRRISRFVGGVLGASAAPRPVSVTLTCGTVEENLANNRAVADALTLQGYDVRLAVNRDAHNYLAWRDTFDPHLTDLLRRVWA